MAEQTAEDKKRIKQLVASEQLKALSSELENLINPEVAKLIFQVDKPH